MSPVLAGGFLTTVPTRAVPVLIILVFRKHIPNATSMPGLRCKGTGVYRWNTQHPCLEESLAHSIFIQQTLLSTYYAPGCALNTLSAPSYTILTTSLQAFISPSIQRISTKNLLCTRLVHCTQEIAVVTKNFGLANSDWRLTACLALFHACSLSHSIHTMTLCS